MNCSHLLVHFLCTLYGHGVLLSRQSWNLGVCTSVNLTGYRKFAKKRRLSQNIPWNINTKTSRAQQDMKVTQITLINIACAKFMCRACHDS